MSQTEDLFARAVDLASDQRSRFLDECELDPQTRGEIESLLRAYDDAGEFFSERRDTNERVEQFDVGAQIGAYELIELLGEGGFARVFRARQSHPVRREVALKLIKLGMDTRAVLQRFELERQALALMGHPSIATVYDAGVTPTGRPYFVMELVRGDRVTRYCENAQLSIADRVRLFIDVCHAVQHAHQKGVLHRDLKPSNILVATIDGEPTPKVIDFGIAKAVGQQLTDATLVTNAGQLLGTPQYMSPEQARSGGADVDTSSDVYSLGAVLYELLAGVAPLDVEPSSSSALEQIQRLTDDEEIPRPSARARDDRRRELRGELDWILGKCLEKDRLRRYVSAAELASDLQAYLENRPITAAPPSRIYRVRKFIGRNRVAVTAAVIVAASLLIGTIVSTTQAIRAKRAERLAQKRLEDTRAANASLTAINDFLTRDMIGAADPAITRGRELTVREALDNAAKAVSGKFKDNPLLEASVRDSVARAYLQLGRADLAMAHAQDVLQRRTALLGESHRDTLSAMNNYGSVLESSSRLAEAGTVFKHAWELSSGVLGDDNPVTLESLHNYSVVLMTTGKLDEAEPLSAEALRRAQRVLGEDDELTLACASIHARTLQLKGRPAEAEPIFRDALTRSQRARGQDDPITISLLNYLALVLKDLGRFADAEPLQKTGLEQRRRILGDEHPDTIASLANYAEILHRLRRPAEAEPLSRMAMELDRRVRGEDSLDTITCINNYSEVLRALGRSQEAEPYAKTALSSAQRVMGPDHPKTLIMLSNYAALLRSLGRVREAEACFHEAIERGRRVRGSDHPDTLIAMNNFATMLKAEKRYAEAEPLYAEVYERASRSQLAPAVAAPLMSGYGPCLIKLAKYADAEQPLREAYRRWNELNQPTNPRMRDIVSGLVEVCERTNRPLEAAQWRAELENLAATKPITP